MPAIWCVHGFGASGDTYLEIFAAPELKDFSIYIPDFPGFGVSPESEKPQGISEAAGDLQTLIASFSPEQKIILLGHSAGGLICTKVAEKMPNVLCVISVEGNLTRADAFFSGKAAEAPDVSEWREELLEKLLKESESDPAIFRYCFGLRRAGEKTLKKWGVTALAESGENSGGKAFMNMKAPSLYVYGKKSVPPETLRYLQENDLRRVEFEHSGHCPMIDETDRFYSVVTGFIRECLQR